MSERLPLTMPVVDGSEQGHAVLRANLERPGFRFIEVSDGVQAVR